MVQYILGGIKMNELCELKGHMWYTSKRKDVKRYDGIYSIAIERCCARCGKTEDIS